MKDVSGDVSPPRYLTRRFTREVANKRGGEGDRRKARRRPAFLLRPKQFKYWQDGRRRALRQKLFSRCICAIRAREKGVVVKKERGRRKVERMTSITTTAESRIAVLSSYDDVANAIARTTYATMEEITKQREKTFSSTRKTFHETSNECSE